jgi:hypothetical protein
MSEYGIMRVPRGRPSARGSGSGWVIFAGAMLLIVSVLNAIYGVSASTGSPSTGPSHE